MGCCVERDCNLIVGWGTGKGDESWLLANFIYEIREVASLLGVSLVHVPLDQNLLADKLAN